MFCMTLSWILSKPLFLTPCWKKVSIQFLFVHKTSRWIFSSLKLHNVEIKERILKRGNLSIKLNKTFCRKNQQPPVHLLRAGVVKTMQARVQHELAGWVTRRPPHWVEAENTATLLRGTSVTLLPLTGTAIRGSNGHKLGIFDVCNNLSLHVICKTIVHSENKNNLQVLYDW